MDKIQNGRHQAKSKTKEISNKENVVFERIVPQAVKQMWMKVSSTPSTRHDYNKNKFNKNTQRNMKEKEISKEFGDAFLSHDINDESNGEKRPQIFYQHKKLNAGVSDSPELPIARSKWGIILRHVERRDPAIYGNGTRNENNFRKLSVRKTRSISQSSDDVLLEYPTYHQLKKSQSIDVLSGDISFEEPPRVDIDKLNESFQDDLRSVKDIGYKFENKSESSKTKRKYKQPVLSSRLSKSEASLSVFNNSLPSDGKPSVDRKDKRTMRTKHRSLAELLQQDEMELTKDVRDDIQHKNNSPTFMTSKASTETPKPHNFESNSTMKSSIDSSKILPPPKTSTPSQNHSDVTLNISSGITNHPPSSNFPIERRQITGNEEKSSQNISEKALQSNGYRNNKSIEYSQHSNEKKAQKTFDAKSTFFQGDDIKENKKFDGDILVDRKQVTTVEIEKKQQAENEKIKQNLELKNLQKITDQQNENQQKKKPKIVHKVQASPSTEKPSKKSPISPSRDNFLFDKSPTVSNDSVTPSSTRPQNTVQPSTPINSNQTNSVYNKLGQVVLDNASHLFTTDTDKLSDNKQKALYESNTSPTRIKYENYVVDKNDIRDKLTTTKKNNVIKKEPVKNDVIQSTATQNPNVKHVESLKTKHVNQNRVAKQQNNTNENNQSTHNDAHLENKKIPNDVTSPENINNSATVKQLVNGKTLNEESTVDLNTPTEKLESNKSSKDSSLNDLQKPISVPGKRTNSQENQNEKTSISNRKSSESTNHINYSLKQDKKSHLGESKSRPSEESVSPKTFSPPAKNQDIESNHKTIIKNELKADVTVSITKTLDPLKPSINNAQLSHQSSSQNSQKNPPIGLSRRVGKLIIMSGEERDLDLKQKAFNKPSDTPLGRIIVFLSNEVADAGTGDESFNPPIIIFNNPPKRVKSNMVAPVKVKRAKKVVTFKTKEIAIIHHYPSEASYFELTEGGDNNTNNNTPDFASYQTHNKDSDITQFIQRERDRISMETIGSPAKEKFRKQPEFTMEGEHFNAFLHDDGAQAMLF